MKSFFKKKPLVIYSPMDGEVVPLTQVPDDVFASGAMGDGVAINPTGDTVYAIADAQADIFRTLHATGFTFDNGLEMIVHFGVDTVALNGEHFTKMSDGGKVTVGAPLVGFDLEAIRSKVPSVLTPVVITDMDVIKEFKVVAEGTVKAGDPLLEVYL